MRYNSVELGVEGLAGGSGVEWCGGQERTGKEGGEGSTHKHRHQTSFSMAIIHPLKYMHQQTERERRETTSNSTNTHIKQM